MRICKKHTTTHDTITSEYDIATNLKETHKHTQLSSLDHERPYVVITLDGVHIDTNTTATGYNVSRKSERNTQTHITL